MTSPVPHPAAATLSGPDAGLLALWDWRREVAALYAALRHEPDGRRAWDAWRAGRDRLFATHAQSPLDPEVRHGFGGLDLFPYDPALRLAVDLEPVAAPAFGMEAGHDGALRLQPFARTKGVAGLLGAELTLFWIAGYGGGVFLPFRDATSGHDTYGGGRYLLDTIKGADLGSTGAALILDFNFAYNPSCCYSPRYVCPLAPRVNALPRAVRAGEKAWHGGG